MTTALLPRGSRFGDIRLDGFLGSGGFSDVYAGRDSSGRRLAVKVLRLSGIDTPAQIDRIQREQAALATVDTRGVARLISSDLTGETPWLASEFVDGPTLHRSIESRGVLSVDESLSFIRRVAEIVHELHTAGIAHRDITPNNIIFGPDGPVLIDFGSARIDLEQDSDGSILIAGTPGFVAPEAERNQAVGQKADIYALGQLFNYCTGNTTAPPEILARASADDPAARPDAAELAAALTNYQERFDRSTPVDIKALPRRFRLRTVGAAATVAAALAAVAALIAIDTEPQPTLTMTSEAAITLEDELLSLPVRYPYGSRYIRELKLPNGLVAAPAEMDYWTPNDSSPTNLRTVASLRIWPDGSDAWVGYLNLDIAPGGVTFRPSENNLDTGLVPRDDAESFFDAFEAYVQRYREVGFGCPHPTPDRAIWLDRSALIVLGSEVPCGTNAQAVALAFRPGSREIFSLTTKMPDTTEFDWSKTLLSAIPLEHDRIEVIRDLDTTSEETEFIDIFTEKNFPELDESVASLEMPVTPEAYGGGRVLFRVEPYESFILGDSYPRVLAMWALVESDTIGWNMPSSVIGLFDGSQPFEETPVFTNTTDMDLIVVIDAMAGSFTDPTGRIEPARIGVLSGSDPELLSGSLTGLEALTMFMDLAYLSNSERFGFENSFDPSAYLLNTLTLAEGFDAARARTDTSIDTPFDVKYAQIGAFSLPYPARYTASETRLNGMPVVFRANSYGFSSAVVALDQLSEMVVSLPQLSEAMSTDAAPPYDRSAPSEACATTAWGVAESSGFLIEMEVLANCIHDGYGSRLPVSFDVLRSVLPRVRISLFKDYSFEQYPRIFTGTEILRADLSLGRSEDIAYATALTTWLKDEATFLASYGSEVITGEITVTSPEP